MLSGGTVLGWVGELHPLAVDAFEATAPVVAFELDVEAYDRYDRLVRAVCFEATRPQPGQSAPTSHGRESSRAAWMAVVELAGGR